MTSRDSCVIRRLLSIVVHFLLTFAAAADTCSFPDYLQSRDGARRWRSHVTFTDGDRCVWRDVSFVGDVWETRVTSGHCPPHDTDSATLTSSYRRRCVKSLNRQRHIVRHRFVTGNTSRYDVNRQQQDGYSCVEFVRRGPTVVQLRESMPTWTTTRFLETACGDAVAGLTLALDGWLLVDYGPAFFQSDEQCPFVDGGFSVRVFDKLFRRGVCDAFNDETRVESRCSADENDRIHFRFRYRECVPEGLGMGVNQPAYCLASWTDDEAGVFAYTLLRHQYSQRTWCLRYPAAAVSRQSAQRRRPFSAFLFRDAFCDHGRTSVATERYLLVDFTPSSGDGDDDSSEGVVDGRLLCRDDYEACAYWGQPCRHAGSAQMLACARRCGICSDDRPAACQMSQHLRGQWSLKLRPSHRQADSAPVSDVVITQHFVQINGANATVRLQCVTWDSLEFIVVDQQSNRSSSTVERMFVRTFKNGCRPRYECIQFRLAAPGILLYRRSRYRLWPFNGTTGIIVDCSSLFTYDEVGYQLLVSTSGLQTRCRLPADVVNAELSVELKSGLRCRGVIRIGSALITSFKLLLRDCPQGHDSEQIYRCLDSIRQYNEHGVKTGDSVVVSADSADGDLLCWWFGHTHPTRIFLLTAAACYDARMMETIQPLAIFTRPNSTSGPASGVVTSTSVSAPSRELSESEINPVTVAKNGSKNAVLYRRLLETLISVAVVSVMC